MKYKKNGSTKSRLILLQRVYGQLLLFCTLLMITNSLHSQQTSRLLKGKIIEDSGSPISAATINIIGKNQKVISDDSGRFQIQIADGDSLEIRSIGHEEKKLFITDQQDIIITLAFTHTDLNEVVVIGYQSVLKKDLTGATGVANMNNARKISAGTIAESIQGTIPGVTVRNGGAPGQNSLIEIRGVGSFSNASPLYVIDGMLSDANVTINPDDIESLQILKDASAAAIYGSRAGNGVVIITTKKGKNGPPIIAFSAKYGRQSIPRQMKLMDAPQYLQTVSQAYANSNATLPSFVSSQLANNTIDVDWQKAVYRASSYQDYNVSVSGGSPTSKYFISGGYYQNDGTVVGNSFNRASFRINSEVKKGILTFGENLTLTASNNKYPGGGVNAFTNTSMMLPTIKVQDPSYTDPINYPSNPQGWGMGSTDNPSYANNYLAAASLDKISIAYGKVIGNVYAGLKLTNWLDYKFNAGLEVSYDYTKEVRDTGVWRYTNQPSPTFVSENRARFLNILLEHTLNFNKRFGLHSINGVVGFSRIAQQQDYTTAARTNLQNFDGTLYTTIGSAVGSASVNGGTTSEWRNHGWLSRINYTYNDKYLLTLTGRIDKSSRFAPSHRTGYFPSMAAAWRISKEKFFNVDWISDLKLRGSYGKLGFSDALGSWDYLGLVSSTARGIYGQPQIANLGQYRAAVLNPNIRWEKRQQSDIGFDAAILNNRLSFSFDWYRSISKDVLLQVPLANYLGTSGSPFLNSGSIRNTGVEFSATYRNNSGPFKWDVSGNFTTIKNTVLSVGDQGVDASGKAIDYLESATFARSQVGHAMGAWYVIQTDGLFQSYEEVLNYKNVAGVVIQPNAKPGDIKYKDLNGDGQITNADRAFEGSPWPTLQTGLQFNGTYKGFNVNVQFIGIFGNKIYNGVRAGLDGYQLTNFRRDLSPWTPDNTNTSDPRLGVDNGVDLSIAANNMAQTDRWLENGSYVRLRNFEIGYGFEPNWLNRLGLKTLRVSASAQNLFTITKYKGMDPDVANGNLGQRGFDGGYWPSSRIFSLGINLEF
ncbi:SusC/RagA family TonB-linked outer membrane protein [Rhizosphaericola mali]|uniref:TonB-dependent receptor n=1 Tax=Rhizosphaericola mali TaxID=2545455 RepID=A0A5P2G495_9BACT|nr:TonB-dependent receptor [Rhizosphaericola mali]QES88580.1 TonB-dependent receptor [Rhizosphaericola mali]